MMKIADIPKYIFCAGTGSTVQWSYLESNLEDWGDVGGIKGFLGLNLDPDFQRGHVWSEQKQIEYVEYILSGGMGSRDILFNHPNWMGTWEGEMVLVDGKQRLEAVRKFVRGELGVFGGNTLNDFDNPKRLLRSHDCHFTVKINTLKTRREVLEWYLQLNSGGVVHTQEELDKVGKMLEEEVSKEG